MLDELGRTPYAVKIASEIEEKYKNELEAYEQNNKHERENIIFAISGKWGEGKSGLLDLIEEELQKRKFQIIRFNPWKYSQKDISLKRAFLRTINKELNLKFDLEDLYFDRSKTKFNLKNLILNSFWWILLLFAITVFCLILVPYINRYNFTYWNIDITNNVLNHIEGFINTYKEFILAIVIIPIITSITISKRAGNIATAEEFEEIFKKMLEGKEKIVIFIDDLDRCNAKTVKIILDSLRTFFQNPECSFIITGDHTVIERAAGEALDLDKNVGEQIKTKEGRRFLKKLFDVYWRLPKPTPHQFSNFVDIKLKKLNLDEVQKTYLKLYLTDEDLFESNLRHVIRFVDKLRFAIETLHLQLKEFTDSNDDSSKDSRKAIEDILKNPSLLAKILLIEEFLYPLYEGLIIHPEEYINHEIKIRNDINTQELKINNIPITDKKYLPDPIDIQKYISIVNSMPKFTDEENTIIHEAASYFFFSGTTGLPSSIGPDETKLVEYLKNGQLVEKLGKALQATTQDANKKFAQRSINEFDKTEDINEKITILTEITKMCELIEEWCIVLNQINEKIYSLPSDKHKELIKLFFQAALAKDPSIIIKIKNEKPDLFENFWEVFNNTQQIDEKTKNFIKKEIIIKSLEKSNLNLKNVCFYIKKYNIKEIETELKKNLNDLESHKIYLENLKSINLIEEPLGKYIKENLIENCKIENLSWILTNKEYLKELNIYEKIKQNIIKNAEYNNNIFTIIENSNEMELDEQDKKQIFDNIKKLISKWSKTNLIFVEKTRDFLTKDQRIEIFKLILPLAEKQQQKIKNNMLNLLKKDQLFWHDLTYEEINSAIDRLKNKTIKKQVKKTWEKD